MDETREIIKLYTKSIQADKKKDMSNLVRWMSDSSTICIYSSIHPSSFGKITSISSSIITAVRYSPQELVGKNISSLFPKLIAEFFDSVLVRNFKSDEQINNYFEFHAFLQHRDDYIVPCKVFSMMSLHSEYGLCLGTIISILKEDPERLLLDHEKKVVSMTKKFKSLIEKGTVVDISKTISFEELLNMKPMDVAKMNTHQFDEYTDKRFLAAALNLVPEEMIIDSMKINTIKLEKNQKRQSVKSAKSNYTRVHKFESVDDLTVSDERVEDGGPKYLEEDFVGNHRRYTKKLNNKLFKQNSKKFEQKILDHIHNNSHRSSLEDYNLQNGQVNSQAMDERQSIYTQRSVNMRRKIDVFYEDLHQKLPFRKFIISHCLFFAYCIFLILFGASLYTAYRNSLYSTNEISQRIEIMTYIVNRNRNFLYLARAAWLDQVYDDYLYLVRDANSIATSTQLNQLTALNVIKNYSEYNNKLQTLVNNLDDTSLKAKLYEKNIRVYFGGYTNITASSNYSWEDNFRASAALMADFNFYLKRMLEKTTKYRNTRDRIYANLYNDYQIATVQLEATIEDSIKSLLEKMDTDTQYTFIITFTFLGLFVVFLITIFIFYYLDTVKFLALFGNHSAHDLSNRVRTLEKLKLSIEAESKKDFEIFGIDEQTYFEEKVKAVHKIFDTKKFFFQIFLTHS